MFEDLVGGFGPRERLAAVVVGVDVLADGVGEVGDRGEGAAAYGLAGDDAEEDLDQVEPGSRGRGEVQGDPGVLGEPCLHAGVLVGGVVVGDHVQLHPGVGFADLLEEA